MKTRFPQGAARRREAGADEAGSNTGGNRCRTPKPDRNRVAISEIISAAPRYAPEATLATPTCAVRRIFDTIYANLRLSQEVIPVVGAFE